MSFDVIGLAGGWWHEPDRPCELAARVIVAVPAGADEGDIRDRFLRWTERLEVTA